MITIYTPNITVFLKLRRCNLKKNDCMRLKYFSFLYPFFIYECLLQDN